MVMAGKGQYPSLSRKRAKDGKRFLVKTVIAKNNQNKYILIKMSVIMISGIFCGGRKVQKTWFIADTHFGHTNIIKYEKRPFSSAQEMDTALINNWNTCVKKEDKIFILGDFVFLPSDQTIKTAQNLNGYKILVLGNHDRNRSVIWWQKAGFNEVSAYPIILDDFYILSHEPMYLNKNMPYANIFGHVHGNPMYTDCSSQSFCVSVERIGYAPIEFEEIKRRMQESSFRESK